MPQFPNYSMNNYPQYGNQTYQSSYPQMMQYPNPYMDRLNQMQNQQMMQSAQVPGTNQNPISGKIVESVDIVRATDIPMDGNLYYFPKADGSEIFTKQWLPNGTTQILTYKPINEDFTVGEQKTAIKGSDELTQGIIARIDELSEKIDKLSKPARTKKESASDE